MSVYLGNAGGIEITRSGEPIRCELKADDVSVEQRRFSIDFDPNYDGTRPSPLITGDQVQFSSEDGTTNLTLVQGMTDTDVTRWVHVDQLGGIRLYSSYNEAVTGGKDNAIELEAPSADQSIVVDVVDVQGNCVAQMREWELTTQRETVDLSILGEEFRASYDQGLISGQGRISAIWDYKWTACTDKFDADAELANYFSQLVIRFREGARFKAVFFVYRCNTEAVWYESDCICTSVGLDFSPGQVIASTIQFITTGQIQLKQGQPPGYLLQENADELLLEEDPGAIELEFAV